MNPAVASALAVPTEAAVREHLEAFARGARPDERVLVLRARAEWTGPDALELGGRTVRVVAGQSQLGVLDALVALGPEELLAVVTPLTEEQLGSAVMLRAAGQRVRRLDTWSLVPGMFEVRPGDLDPALHAMGGNWLPEALLHHKPPGGWPRQTGRTLSAGTVIRLLLSRVLGIGAGEQLDAARVLEQLDQPAARSSWLALDDAVREGLTTAAARVLGAHVGLALHAVATGTDVAIAAIGLTADMLWPGPERPQVDADGLAARVRLEKLLGPGLRERDLRSLAGASIAGLLRREAGGDEGYAAVLDQAEALQADLGWPAGARRSPYTRAGMIARLDEVGATVRAWLDSSDARTAAAVEDAVRRLRGHAFAQRYGAELFAADMAARLVRRLTTAPVPAAGTVDEALNDYAHDGGWVDRAIAAVWVGSLSAATAGAYAQLAERARADRHEQDRRAAALLTGEPPAGLAIPVEQLLERVVMPLSRQAPVLLLVVDGMSVATATEIAQDALAGDWVEVLPAGQQRRSVALAALPTVTTYSRTSLLSGQLLSGDQSTERTRFVAQTTGVIFHKDELRSGAGQELPDTVLDAITDTRRGVVAVVLNTIDDALAKHDPGGTRWNLAAVQHLRALLDAAAGSARAVVLVSDHGHVVERGSRHRPTTPSAPGARWRSPDSGPAVDDEVLISGSRVLAPGGSAILAVDEDLRYLSKAAGYHGGASLAELTVPVITLRSARAAVLRDWPDAVPQTPEWWSEAPVAGPTPAKPARRAPKKPRGEQPPAMFEVESDDATQGSMAEALTASERYRAQRARAGRRALDDDVVRQAIGLLHERGGRMHRDAFGAALAIPATAIDPRLAALRRLLNVDGYDVVSLDRDGKTIVLDIQLLREQFGLRQP